MAASRRIIHNSSNYDHLQLDQHDDVDDDEDDNRNITATMTPLEIMMDDDDDDEVVQQQEEEERDGIVVGHEVLLGGDIKSAILGIIKGMVGPAILYLPHGFANAGYLVAIPILFLSATLFLSSSSCLLKTWKLIQSQSIQTTATSSTMIQNNGNDVVIERGDDDDDIISTVPSSTSNNPQQQQQQQQPVSLSYPDLAYRAFGTKGETAVKIGIAAMQSGVCLTYLIFVPQNLYTSMKSLTNGNTQTTPFTFLILMLIIQIPLSWIRDIRKLTVTNALANALILYGLIICLIFAFTNAIEQTTTTTTTTTMQNEDSQEETMYDTTETLTSLSLFNKTKETTITKIDIQPKATHDNDVTRTVTDLDLSSSSSSSSTRGPIQEIIYRLMHLTPFNSNGWFLFIGTSVLLFEGSITLLIPLQEAVIKPRDRQQFPTIYPKVILGIITFYIVFGIICWMSFGDSVDTVMTTSLPTKSLLSTTVQLAYSVAVMFTFPLQNFPSLEITTKAIATSIQNTTIRITGGTGGGRIVRFVSRLLQRRNIIASFLVICLGIIASLTMERLDKVVSLMGSLLGCPLAFCFPPLIQNQLDASLSVRKRIQNNIIVCLGFGAMIIASVATLWTW